MRHLTFVLVFCFSVAASIFGSAAAENDRAVAWREDIQTVQRALYRVHPEPFHQIQKHVFDDEFAALSRSVDELTDQEIFVRLFRIVSFVHDGHTVLVPFGSGTPFNKWYPIRFAPFGDALYVEAIAAEHSDMIGAKLISYNGRPANEVLARATDFWNLDNQFSTRFRAPYLLTSAQFAVGAGISDDIESISVELETREGAKQRLTLESFEQDFHWEWYPTSVTIRSNNRKIASVLDVVQSQQPYFRNRELVYWFENFRRDRIFYVKIDAMHHDEDFDAAWITDTEYDRFENFNNALWKSYDRSRAKSLIVDLRDNFGGNTLLFQLFLKEARKRQALFERGNLMVVTGDHTFSASSVVANLLKRDFGAIIMGSPHGNGSFTNADSLLTFLPNSGHILLTSIFHWDTELYPWRRRRVIMPDIPVFYDPKDYFAGHDPLIQRVKDYRNEGDPLSAFEGQYLNGGVNALETNWSKIEDEFPDRLWWNKEQALLDFGLTLEERGKDDDAMAIYQLAAAKYPQSVEAALVLARLYIDAVDFSNAALWVERTLALEPSNALARRLGSGLGIVD